jgi:mannobiose 2-epimerase
MDKKQLAQETKEHLLGCIIPFWRGLRDDTYGGYFGWVDHDLHVDKQAMKGCILNSRITWFFSNAYALYRQGLITEEDCRRYGFTGEDLKAEADHAYWFLREKCIDRTNGGIYWSLTYDGRPDDTTKHTYNQAFCIYALSSYYDISGDREALALAEELVELIETRCTDEIGYLEAFTIDFQPESNEKLSENGVMAEKTMNTMLHVFEAYTELYRVSKNETAGKRLRWMMDTIAEKIYNPRLKRQEVFFDRLYQPIIDLHSYGHDIEASWLIDRGTEVLGDDSYKEKMSQITQALTANIYKTAFDGHSLANECERGVVNECRIWWVQAETVIGFLNGYEKTPEHTEYLDAACSEWKFIREHVVDKRAGSEWFREVDKEGNPYPDSPIVEQWKCPYHNGRMCMEVIRRNENFSG